MKKIYSLLLIIALVFSNMSFANVSYAADNADKPGWEYTPSVGEEVNAQFISDDNFKVYYYDSDYSPIFENEEYHNLRYGEKYRIKVDSPGFYKPVFSGCSGISVDSSEDGVFTVTGASPVIKVSSQERTGDIWMYENAFIVGNFSSVDDFLNKKDNYRLQTFSEYSSDIFGGDYSSKALNIVNGSDVKFSLKSNFSVKSLNLYGITSYTSSGNVSIKNEEAIFTAVNGIKDYSEAKELYFEAKLKTSSVSSLKRLDMTGCGNVISGNVNVEYLNAGDKTDISGTVNATEVTVWSDNPVTMQNINANYVKVCKAEFSAKNIVLTKKENQMIGFYADEDAQATVGDITSAGSVDARDAVLNADVVSAADCGTYEGGSLNADKLTVTRDMSINDGSSVTVDTTLDVYYLAMYGSTVSADTIIIRNYFAYLDKAHFNKLVTTDDRLNIAELINGGLGVYKDDTGKNVDYLYLNELEYANGLTVDSAPFTLKGLRAETHEWEAGRHGSLHASFPEEDGDYECIWYVYDEAQGKFVVIEGDDGYNKGEGGEPGYYYPAQKGQLLFNDGLDVGVYTMKYSIKEKNSDYILYSPDYTIIVSGGYEPEPTDEPIEPDTPDEPVVTKEPVKEDETTPAVTPKPTSEPADEPGEPTPTDIPAATQAPIQPPVNPTSVPNDEDKWEDDWDEDDEPEATPHPKGYLLKYQKGIYRVIVAENYDDENVIASVSFVKPEGSVKVFKVPDTIDVDDFVYDVVAIEPKAFKGQKSLIKVTISDTVESIGKQAFAGCKKLKNIIIETESLNKNSVGAGCFKGVPKKAFMKVPKKKKAAYAKMFKKKGFKGKVK